ncbi:MAG TPA: sulfurtransferase [Acidimicrobiales bacterium]|nr:sulfurtransferase [Acidimicrobiales bacterium]
MDALVSTGWLAEHLDDDDLVVLDATVDIDPTAGTVISGRARWERGHIPGAVFADLLTDLSDPGAPTPLMMPSPERAAEAFGDLGVGDGSRVVVYDARESMWAARVWWMLHSLGHPAVAVLDGGWTAWEAEGRPVSTEAPAPRPTTFTPRPRPELFVGKEDVRSAIDDPRTIIVDALTPKEYRGEAAFYGRPGHLPGAVNVPARSIVDRETQRFRPADELRELFGPALAAESVVTYCGGGVAASSDAFALRLLGHERVAVYDGSMMEWAADPELPLVTGEGPGGP